MKFYVLTLLTIMISVYISNVNYTSTIRSVMSSTEFVETLKVLQKEKKMKLKSTHSTFRIIVITKINKRMKRLSETLFEDAGINYKAYMTEGFDKRSLEEWQIKRLEDIKKIKVKKIHASDLQEQGYISTTISMLPISQREHQKNFLISGIIQKTITSALSGMVVAFGVVLGNWFLGLTYGLTILISFISSVVIATDFVTTTLRNRYIAKADLLKRVQ